MALGESQIGPTREVQGQATARATDVDLHELLTVDELATLLKVSRSWIYEHTRARGVPRADRLPHIRVGKYVRFDPRTVRAFLERQCRVR